MSLSSAPTIEALPASVTSSGKWGDASSALGPSCRWKETAVPRVRRLLCWVVLGAFFACMAPTLSSQGCAAQGSASGSVWFLAGKY